MIKFAVLLAVLPLVLANVVPVKQCKSGPLPSSVDVVGCSSVPCKLPRGHDAIAHVNFSPDVDVSALRPVVYATALGVTVPFELPKDHQNACNWLEGSQCPLSAGEDVSYLLKLPVQKFYPPIPINVELQLVDQSDEVVTCFKLQAKVV
ncbi:NPC intracellular cholesterol transporter 2-like [Malaya genurostris]|uniref:NPC intracellular cholesterol transporter 2-like n=1 Tax=Malaya genurostris TaxID=325434 RepID=UPI0026F3E919|nr:NPC intracellular cholesterol transporter 2-like [Malaya genurostris]